MMPRWRFSLAALVLGLTVILAGAAHAKPNIIVILTDDQEVSLVQQMPNLAALLPRPRSGQAPVGTRRSLPPLASTRPSSTWE